MEEIGEYKSGRLRFPFVGLKPSKVRGKKEPNGGRQVRPTNLQKFCKKFNASRDPYDHVAQY